MKVISKEKSKLIDRTEVIVEISHQGKPTPTTNEIRKKIAEEFKAKEELVVIKLIDTKFGEGTSIVSAYIYDNLDELKKLEKYEEPKKEEEKPTEESKQEEKKEESKEEGVKENGQETKAQEQSSE
jgi:small subunit ribosomal protein S24e